MSVPTLASIFGRNVRALRTERGWSQATLAVRAGCHALAILRIEKGYVRPRLNLVVGLRRAFNCSWDSLFSGLVL